MMSRDEFEKMWQSPNKKCLVMDMRKTEQKRRGRGREILAWALGISAIASCLGPTAGTVSLSGFDKPVEQPLAFAEGKELSFAVHTDEYEYSGRNHILIQVTLLRAGAAVGTMSCAGFEFEGGSGCGSSATHMNSACAIKVPAGGSDAIRMVATLEDPGNKATVKGLSVYIRD